MDFTECLVLVNCWISKLTLMYTYLNDLKRYKCPQRCYKNVIEVDIHIFKLNRLTKKAKKLPTTRNHIFHLVLSHCYFLTIENNTTLCWIKWLTKEISTSLLFQAIIELSVFDIFSIIPWHKKKKICLPRVSTRNFSQGLLHCYLLKFNINTILHQLKWLEMV